jgi:hypothetical protein
MGELGERRWAVISERGCESASLEYMEAVEMMRSLSGRKLSGLCIVTNEAAARLPRVKAAAPDTPPQPVKTHSKA